MPYLRTLVALILLSLSYSTFAFTIEGNVTSAATGNGVGGITACLYHLNGDFAGDCRTSETGTGRYFFEEGVVAPDQYTLLIQTEGTEYLFQIFGGVDCKVRHCDFTDPAVAVVDVTSANVTGADVVLTQGVYVHGVIRDETGTGLDPAVAPTWIGVFDPNGNWYGGSWWPSSTGEVDFSVPAGDYYFAVEVDEYASSYRREIWNNISTIGWYDFAGSGSLQSLTMGTAFDLGNMDLEMGTRISGVVHDETGAGMEGVEARVFDSVGTYLKSAWTNSDGAFTMQALPSGTYYLLTQNEPDGYIREGWDNHLCPGDVCDVTSTDAITLVAGTDYGLPYPIVLDKGARIEGTIMDADGGRPIEGATITLYDAKGDVLTSNGRDALEYFSDELGHYSADNLIPGDYTLLAADGGYANALFGAVVPDCSFGCDVTQGEVISVVGLNIVISGKNVSLERRAVISGVVTDSTSGLPLEGIVVNISLPGRILMADPYTGADGSYTAGGLPDGSYQVFVTPTDGWSHSAGNHIAEDSSGAYCIYSDCYENAPQSVVTSEATPNLTTDFQLEPGGTISGRVAGPDGKSLEDNWNAEAWIELGVEGKGSNIRQVPMIDSEGNYSVTALPPGKYYPVHVNYGWGNTRLTDMLLDTPCPRGSCDFKKIAPVVISGTETHGNVNSNLPIGAALTGTLTHSGNADPNLQWKSLAIYSDQGIYAGYVDVETASGEFKSRTSLPVGTWYLSSYFTRNQRGLGSGFIDELFDDIPCVGGCSFTSGSPIVVTAIDTEISGITVSLENGGTISGTITDDASTPLAVVRVAILDTAGKEMKKNLVTDSTGFYELGGLPVGEYRVVTNNDLGYLDEVYPNASCEPFCNPLTVPGATTVSVVDTGEVQNINFQLNPAAMISGKVTRASDSADLQGISVEIYDALGTLISQVLTGVDGTYEAKNLVVGHGYYAQTQNSLGWVDQLYAVSGNQNCAGAACDPLSGDSITAPSATIDFVLSPSTTISGTVENVATSAKLGGIRVDLYDLNGVFVATNTSAGTTGAWTVSGLVDGGYFAVTRETAGYVDEAWTSGGGITCPTECSATTGEVLTLSGEDLTNRDFLLSQGHVLEGDVTALSATQKSVGVEVYNENRQLLAEGVTDLSGHYRIIAVPEQSVFIRTRNSIGYIDQLYSTEGRLDINDGVDVTSGSPFVMDGNKNLDFDLPVGGAITGSVVSGASSLSSLPVQAYDSAGNLVAQDLTDSSGLFNLAGMPVGNFYLKTADTTGYINQMYEALDCTPGPCEFSSAAIIPLGTSVVTLPSLDLGVGESITGTAVDASNNPLPSGSAVLYSESGEKIMETPITAGHWEFVGVANGDYYVLIAGGTGLVDVLYGGVECPGGSCDITSGTKVTISDANRSVDVRAPTTGLDVSMNSGTRLSGSVESVNGPIANAVVAILDGAGQHTVGSATTDAAGKFRTDNGFPDGSYKYLVDATGYINELYDNVECPQECNTETEGTAIPHTTTPAFVLAAGQAISGTIAREAGSPLNGARVEAHKDGYLAGFAISDLNGSFHIEGLPNGSYVLKAINITGYADQQLHSTWAAGSSGVDFAVPCVDMLLGVVHFPAGVVLSCSAANEQSFESDIDIQAESSVVILAKSLSITNSFTVRQGSALSIISQ